MNTIESKAIFKCQQGELEHFSVLYELYFDKIYKFIFFKTLHRETAEDITSKTFFKAMDGITNFNEAKGSFASWLFVIARRAVIDHYRTSKQRGDYYDCWEAASNEDVFGDIANRQELEKINKFLRGLQREKRDLIIMRVWQDLSYKDISQITGKSEASLKMMFSRTISRLRSDTANALAVVGTILLINN